MTDESRAHVSERPGPFPLSPLLLVPVAMALLGGLCVLVFAQLAFVPMTLLVVGGLPYAILASVVAVTLRVRAWSGPAVDPVDDPAATGRSSAQRTSFAVAVWLLVLWLVLAAQWAVASPIPLPLAGGPLAAGAVISIAANARLLYSARAARAEVATVRSRRPGRRWILANWVLAPASWFAFAVPAALWGPTGAF